MKKFVSILCLCTVLILVGAINTGAARYKFSFDMNTGMWNRAAHTDVAYKVTRDENPVLRVHNVESRVRMKFWVVNSNGDARSSIVTTRGPQSGGSSLNFTLDNMGMAQNYQYRMRAQTDDGKWYSRYNVTGAWNPDTW